MHSENRIEVSWQVNFSDVSVLHGKDIYGIHPSLSIKLQTKFRGIYYLGGV